ncbi:hypothetical protein [Pseudomonas sp. JUb52]|uniref:hypothetical protein n=1 Tax=Pseudomonas sp. JUb52 TaxID=2485127 RepID=UPI001048A4AB|nr:hypothetical protein [Pseudomonas sp. JUb52]TCQ94078.1 hypothetical protein EC839_101199 [Pseudomonas sp. JUb52]
MNMKQSCKALICAIEGELDGRHCTEEQAAAILDHALPSLTEALALAEAERDRYKAAWMEFMDRTDWMQEKGQVPAKYLAQHRADVLTAMLNEARAALATQPAAGEQIYQLRNPKIGPEWHEVDQVAYDEFSSMPAYERRTLWTAPPAAAHGDEAVRKDATESAIQRACGVLPEGWSMQIDLERDAGWVTLFNPWGRAVDFG